jgi:Tlde1 domain
MTWRYDQSTGDLEHNGEFAGTGYSGAGRTLAEGRNNPAMEAVRQKGPIPAGEWRIGPAHAGAHTGPVSMDLTPVGHDAHGRTAFLIHGDNTAHNASEGCIILARGIRDQIAASGDRQLIVVP